MNKQQTISLINKSIKLAKKNNKKLNISIKDEISNFLSLENRYQLYISNDSNVSNKYKGFYITSNFNNIKDKVNEIIKELNEK